MADFRFTIQVDGDAPVTVEGDESRLCISQPDTDGMREVDDDDMIYLPIDAAKELHRKLGEILNALSTN